MKRACTACEKEQICNKLRKFNRDAQKKKLETRLSGKAKAKADAERAKYLATVNANAQANKPLKLQGFWTIPGGPCEDEVKEKSGKG